MQQPASSKQSRRYWLAALALLALSAAGWAARGLLFGPEVTVATVVRRELVQTVVASGRAETPLREHR
jgi:HlyD family secretion protein